MDQGLFVSSRKPIFNLSSFANLTLPLVFLTFFLLLFLEPCMWKRMAVACLVCICIFRCPTSSFIALSLEVCWGLPWLKIHPDIAIFFSCRPLQQVQMSLKHSQLYPYLLLHLPLILRFRSFPCMITWKLFFWKFQEKEICSCFLAVHEYPCADHPGLISHFLFPWPLISHSLVSVPVICVIILVSLLVPLLMA